MNVTIYGVGYVGLVTGACLAKLGHNVLCIDIDVSKIENLQRGQIPIFEPHLEELVIRNLQEKCLAFSVDFSAGVQFSEIQIITVNTPTKPNQGSDIGNILAVSEAIAEQMQEPKIIVNKSTAPPGTVQKIHQCIHDKLLSLGKKIAFDVASNPEFLKEGQAVKDFLEPDRILLGIDNETIRCKFLELYEAYSDKLLFMDTTSAELGKYAANAILATKISFMNELANISECIGADIEAVKDSLALDPRIGPHFINPGCGYGGSCFPKDVQALIHFAQSLQLQPQLLEAVEAVNVQQKQVLAKKVLKRFGDKLSGKVIAIWGLAFKPNTNDMREASSISLINALIAAGATIHAYDPIANTEARTIFAEAIANQQVVIFDSKEETISNTNTIIIVTEWEEFVNAPLTVFKNKIVFDGRNIFNPKLMREANIEYISIGR